ncbi:MAG: ribbon-helix-helix domain-containing protein [Candidatus Bathyarchaeia archaeon]
MVSEKIRIDSNLLRSIDMYLESSLAKSKGFRNRRDVIEEAIRRFLENEGFWSTQRFKHINMYRDHVIIMDKLINRVVTVYFKPPNKTYCDACSTGDCEHIVYALTMNKILKILKRKGFKIENNLEEFMLKLINRSTPT